MPVRDDRHVPAGASTTVDKAISGNQTVELLTQPLIIQESEILKGQAGNANRLHIIVSLMEKT